MQAASIVQEPNSAGKHESDDDKILSMRCRELLTTYYDTDNRAIFPCARIVRACSVSVTISCERGLVFESVHSDTGRETTAICHILHTGRSTQTSTQKRKKRNFLSQKEI